MKSYSLLLLSVFFLQTTQAQSHKKTVTTTTGTGEYFPPAGEWQHRSPTMLGMDSVKMAEAIRFAIESESKMPRDQVAAQAIGFRNEPYDNPIGALPPRGAPSGIIIYKGYIVGEWGEPSRVDMTNSVTKSFLSAVVGVAVDQGLIHSEMDTVAAYVPPIEIYDPTGAGASVGVGATGDNLIYPFASDHNKTLTWDVMLRQTSDWEGTLWGKPDWADRPSGKPEEWIGRKRNAPGSVWKYNDVRVNALALAATSVWRKPLPQVLKTYIMDPIGASTTWRWNGYRNAWIVLDGQPVQSVSGGGHWGGGMFINAYDMGRFGLLTLHRGKWNGRQLLSESWVQKSLTPTPANTGYGYMNWFLNTDHKQMPSAPLTAFVHIGNGVNYIYVDPEHDLVAVIRWVEGSSLDGIVKRLLAALPGAAGTAGTARATTSGVNAGATAGDAH